VVPGGVFRERRARGGHAVRAAGETAAHGARPDGAADRVADEGGGGGDAGEGAGVCARAVWDRAGEWVRAWEFPCHARDSDL